LKRVLVGGIDRVYEVGKCFRNEGVSTEHNPEFTMLEIYQAYADCETMMALVERLVLDVLDATRGGSRAVTYKGETIDFEPPWPRVRMLDVVAETSGVDVSSLSADEIDRRARGKGIDLPDGTAGKKIEALFERFAEPTLVRPTIVYDYPVEISPLAKRHPEDDRLVERFELFVGGGMELANAFTELNDPIDQRARFEAQERLREAGDEEAHGVDEDFLFALEHGMPPAGGMGVGIDRLAMVLTGLDSIRDVILFPTLRERKS
jgi:lysyl-tRNA synthetase class 2